MPDLSTLSDEQLEALSRGDMASLPDEVLEKLSAGDSDTVVNEPLPEFTGFSKGALTRFIAKNLGSTPQGMEQYVREKMPELEVKSIDGKIVARRKGDTGPFRPMDPSGMPSSVGEAVQDVGDVAYDIGAGVGSGIATAAGGLGTLWSGGLPGAMAAGAASSAGLEGIRKGLGRAAGVEQEFTGDDLTDVALSGAFGGASPLLFGSGATAKQIAKTVAGDVAKKTAAAEASQAGLEGIAKNVVSDQAKKAGKEALSEELSKKLLYEQRGLIGKALPKVGSTLSGVSEEAIDSASQNMARMAGIKTAPTKHTAKAIDKVKEGFIEETKRLAKVKQDALDAATASGKTVDLAPLRAEFEAAIKKAEKLEKSTGFGVFGDELAALKSDYAQHFGKTTSVPSGFLDLTGTPAMKSVVPPNKIGLSEARSLQQRLNDLGKISQQNLQGVGMQQKTNFQSSVEKIGRSAADKIGEQIDATIPGVKEVDDQISNLLKLQSESKTYLKNRKTAGKTFRNINSSAHDDTRVLFKEIDKNLGTDLYDMAQQRAAADVFGKPKYIPQSGGGGSSWTRTGMGAGIGAGTGWTLGLLSGIPGAAPVLGGAGGLAGTVAFSPALLKQYIKAGGAMKGAAKSIPFSERAMQAAPYSAWNALANEQE